MATKKTMEKSRTKRSLWQKLKRLKFISKGMTLAEFQERGDDKLQIEDHT